MKHLLQNLFPQMLSRQIIFINSCHYFLTSWDISKKMMDFKNFLKLSNSVNFSSVAFQYSDSAVSCNKRS